jgi:hypothetical protein
MQRETTLESLRRKLATLSEACGLERDPLDLDTFVALEAGCHFSDPALRAPPTVGSVETLTRLGCPRWSLTSKEVFDLLRARRKRGLASVAQARMLRDRGHPRLWAVLFVDVAAELHHPKRGREAKN